MDIQKSVLINTLCGDIEGVSELGMRKFLGIRYATARRWEYAKRGVVLETLACR
jgi:carboxylesterase type B